MAAAREEAEMVLFNSVRSVLDEAHLKPGQVGSLLGFVAASFVCAVTCTAYIKPYYDMHCSGCYYMYCSRNLQCIYHVAVETSSAVCIQSAVMMANGLKLCN